MEDLTGQPVLNAERAWPDLHTTRKHPLPRDEKKLTGKLEALFTWTSYLLQVFSFCYQILRHGMLLGRDTNGTTLLTAIKLKYLLHMFKNA